MAKKTSKGKEKKLARKAENERAAALATQLRELNEGSAVGEQLAVQYPAFQRYDRQGLGAALRFYGSLELPPALLDWALGLTRQHMAALYDACPDWGWSDAKKRAELADPAARFLVVFQQKEGEAPEQRQQQQQQSGAMQQGEKAAQAVQQEVASAGAAAAAGPAAAASGQENHASAGNGGACSGSGASQQQQQQRDGVGPEPALGQPVAFVHFRFEAEEVDAVLYCYEIQVAAAVQGKGLGRFLMRLLELIGRKSGVARLMLTVFSENVAAVQLYRKLGYVLDADSPGVLDASGDHKYEIMTKWLRQPGNAGAGT